MKKTVFSITFSVILLFSLVSCTLRSESVPSVADTVASLEAQLFSMKNEQSVLDSQQQQKLDSIQSQLDALSGGKQNDLSSDTETTDKSLVGFSYTVDDGVATLTGYVGDEKNLVIPATIDGFAVKKIADRAFANTKLKSVIISDGVESVGWFAFDGCVFLSAVTVPQSVTAIGYSAFGANPSELTVYCHNGSFAMKYAQSFGITYALI